MTDQPTHYLSSPELVQLPTTTFAVVRAIVPMNQISEFYAGAYPLLFSELSKQGIRPVAAPVGISFSPPFESIDVGAGIEISAELTDTERVKTHVVEQGPALKVTVHGDYSQLGQAYATLREHAELHGARTRGFAWEQYLTDPQDVADESQHVTDVYWPLAV